MSGDKIVEMLSAEQQVADLYEAMLMDGSPEGVATDAAVIIWRWLHLRVPDSDARSKVARIVAGRREKMRQEGKLRGEVIRTF